jgi:hypothetical protein
MLIGVGTQFCAPGCALEVVLAVRAMPGVRLDTASALAQSGLPVGSSANTQSGRGA